jgi:hypothetical protein
MSSWISGNITCDWITTWGAEHLLDVTGLLVYTLRYMYVSVHYTLWFIDRLNVTRATPELTRLQLHRATPRTEADVLLTQAAALERSLQIYRATAGSEADVRLTQAAALERSLELYRATAGTEADVRLTQAAALERSLQLYRATAGTEADVRLTKCCFGAGKKTPSAKTCTSCPTLQGLP